MRLGQNLLVLIKESVQSNFGEALARYFNEFVWVLVDLPFI